MAVYRAKLNLSSPLGTRLNAATIFGQICILRRESTGEADFERWLHDPNRVWKLSECFPSEFLARPLSLPRPSRSQRMDVQKERKKRTLISRGAWLRFRSCWDDQNLPDSDLREPRLDLRRVAHNHVDRHGNGTLAEGGLYFLTEDWVFAANGQEQGSLVDIYIETEESAAEVDLWLSQLGQFGFGRSASIGRGRWDVVSVDEDQELFSGEGTRRMSLSRGALCPETMQNALWRLETHFGRAGPQVSLTGTSPFKRPVFLVKPGMTFEPIGHGPWGRMLTDVHPTRPEIVHNAFHVTLQFDEAV